MDAAALLSVLSARGLTVRADGSKLVVSPPGLLDGEAAGLIRSHKPALLAWLSRPPRPKAVERQAGLVRLDGMAGWWTESRLKPCGTCGNTTFFIGAGRLGCVQCLRPYPGEKVAGHLTLDGKVA